MINSNTNKTLCESEEIIENKQGNLTIASCASEEIVQNNQIDNNQDAIIKNKAYAKIAEFYKKYSSARHKKNIKKVIPEAENIEQVSNLNAGMNKGGKITDSNTGKTLGFKKTTVLEEQEAFKAALMVSELLSYMCFEPLNKIVNKSNLNTSFHAGEFDPVSNIYISKNVGDIDFFRVIDDATKDVISFDQALKQEIYNLQSALIDPAYKIEHQRPFDNITNIQKKIENLQQKHIRDEMALKKFKNLENVLQSIKLFIETGITINKNIPFVYDIKPANVIPEYDENGKIQRFQIIDFLVDTSKLSENINSKKVDNEFVIGFSKNFIKYMSHDTLNKILNSQNFKKLGYNETFAQLINSINKNYWTYAMESVFNECKNELGIGKEQGFDFKDFTNSVEERKLKKQVNIPTLYTKQQMNLFLALKKRELDKKRQQDLQNKIIIKEVQQEKYKKNSALPKKGSTSFKIVLRTKEPDFTKLQKTKMKFATKKTNDAVNNKLLFNLLNVSAKNLATNIIEKDNKFTQKKDIKLFYQKTLINHEAKIKHDKNKSGLPLKIKPLSSAVLNKKLQKIGFTKTKDSVNKKLPFNPVLGQDLSIRKSTNISENLEKKMFSVSKKSRELPPSNTGRTQFTISINADKLNGFNIL